MIKTLPPSFWVCRIKFARVRQTEKGRGTMRQDEEKRLAKDIAWEMFERTGNISYYMLYHELKRD